MKVVTLVFGLVLAALGLVVALGMVELPQRETLELGPLRASLERREPLPSWVSFALGLAGGVLVGVGLRRR